MKFVNRLFHFFLYLLAFLLPLQTRFIIRPGVINFGYWEYGTYSLYLVDIILIIVLSLAALKLFQKENDSIVSLKINWRQSSFNKALYFLIALELLVFISVFFAPNKILALYHYGLFLLGLGIFFIVKNRGWFSKIKLVYSFLAGIFLQALLAIWQFASQSTFASKYLGMASHDPAAPGAVVLEIYRHGVLTRWLRAYGGLDHPNMLGLLMAVGVLIVVGLIIKRRGVNKKLLLINYGLLFFFGVACLFSFSRSAWLGLFLGLLIIFLIHSRKLFKRKIDWRSSEIKLIMIFSLIFIIIFSSVSTLFTARFDTQNRLEQISTCERLTSFGQAQKIIMAHPFQGVGIGNYTIALFQNSSFNPSYYYQPVHNVFLLAWSELGMVGLLCFLGFLFFLVFWKIKQITKQEIGLAILAVLLVSLMVDHWLFSLHFGIFLFWFVIGLIWPEEEII